MKAQVEWMTRNHVAANLLMLLLIVGGLIYGKTIKREVFPEIEIEAATISVVYPGAAPDEIESGICLPVEDAIASVDGIETIRCVAVEGAGVITAEIFSEYDLDQVVSDIESEVDRIRTFPEEAEDPEISKISSKREVLSLIIHGDVSESTIKSIAENIRDELIDSPDISQAEISGVRNFEISVEIPEEELAKYKLTLDRVAQLVSRSSVDVPGGLVKGRDNEILLRTLEKKYIGSEYENVAVITSPDGTQVKLKALGKIIDGFEDVDKDFKFDGQRAAEIKVYRIGDQGPVEVSDAVKKYIAENQNNLPAKVKLSLADDRSELYKSRLSLLLRNAYFGLIFVVCILGLFLEVRLAFWITLGIPISFLGALFILPSTDVSINMISLFAFILSLGIVVDDAIVVGENIYEHRLRGKDFLTAAVEGTMEVGVPVVFSVLTTIAAFLPMLFVSGRMGKFMWVIPVIVISVLIISLVESLFILPAHLSFKQRTKGVLGPLGEKLENIRMKFVNGLDIFIESYYRKTIAVALRYKYTTISIAIALFISSVGLVKGGYLKLVHLPKIDGDKVIVNLEMPVGTPVEETTKIIENFYQAALRVAGRYNEQYSADMPGDSVYRNILSIVGSKRGGRPHGPVDQSSGGYMGSLVVYLQPGDARSFKASQFKDDLKKEIGEVAGAESIVYRSGLMRMGEAIDVQLQHNDPEVLKVAATQLKAILRDIKGVESIADNNSVGKREFRFSLKPEARTLGISEVELGRQIRSAFYGAEALRFQRGRDEVKVMIRYPEHDRETVTSIQDMKIRGLDGVEVPFSHVAEIEDSTGYSQIRRSQRRRTLNVTADVRENEANVAEIISQLASGELDQLVQDYPGLSYEVEGEEKERGDSMASLVQGFLFSLLLIYTLLAIPFKSYVQPLIIMSAIPFGFIGAALGHILLGFDISILSMCGLVALSGVLVNDSLILIDYINRHRNDDVHIIKTVEDSGCRRFRPIVLTSLTTFCGLMPLIFEKSMQAQFLIPMGISLAFGVLGATVITLYFIPSMYMVIEDIKSLFGFKHEKL